MKTIIIREYLESLTESEELDFLFPILLEAIDYQIVSTPKQTKGLPQYGKDVVAVGIDQTDGIKKRFYFEIKGGSDRHITTSNFSANDGIRESIIEAKDRPFKDSSIPDFKSLPIKIVLVHNGEIKANVKETFDGFIEREFPKSFKKRSEQSFWKKLFRKKLTKSELEFERWDIFKLTELFSKYLFSEYLLTSEEHVSQFKKVLVLLNNPQNDFTDLYQLVDRLINELEDENNTKSLNRKQKLLFQSLALVSYVIYSYARDSHNLESAKRALPYLVLKFWSWLLENKKTTDRNYLIFFDKIIRIYLKLLEEYFSKLIPVAELKDGIWSEAGGRYEQIGYPVRTFEFIEYLVFYFLCLESNLIERPNNLSEERCNEILLAVIRNNVSHRPLLDNHSIPIYLIINKLLKINSEEAKSYLSRVLENIIIAHKTTKRLPDGGNNLEVVMRYILTGEKSVYYRDSTSLLFGMLLEFLGILKMKEEYEKFRRFILEANIDIGIFIPFDDSKIKKYLPNIGHSLEVRLFRAPVNYEGFQSEIKLEEDIDNFIDKTKEKNEFEYNYETDRSNYAPLRQLAHIFFKTSFFPNEWRRMI